MSLIAAAAGAWLGSHLVIKHKPGFIRPFFLLATAAIILKLLWDQYGRNLAESF